MALSTQRQEQPGSPPMGRPQQAEKAGGVAGGRSGMPGPTRLVQAHPLLAEIVDQIADWDFPDGGVARALRTKALPSTAPYLIAQYRVRPLGVLIVRLKPEAAARLMGERMQDFADEKIELGNLFKASDLSLLEEMLMEAPDSAARFARIQSFLLRNLHTRQPDPVVCRAAQSLRRNPALRVRRLAAQLDVSERHLSRSFRAMFGASPKQFARVARIEKILAMRQGGSAWAAIAYACGFTDQAHMINDFGAIVGEPPQQLFRTTADDTGCEGNTSIGQSAGPNFLTFRMRQCGVYARNLFPWPSADADAYSSGGGREASNASSVR
jgi:AraC-like DNA-binding protein